MMLKTILIPVEDSIKQPAADEGYYGVSIGQVNTTYTRRTGPEILQQYSIDEASDTFGKFYQRFSRDNGRTWAAPSLLYEPEKKDDAVLRWGESCLFLDDKKNAILHFFRYDRYPKVIFSGEVGKYIRIFSRFSFDGGKSFSQPEQLIQKGFDENNWANGVFYGRNGIAISFCAPIKTKAGKLLVPIVKIPLDFDVNNIFLVPHDAGCFIGAWKHDHLEWELSDMVKIDPKLSSRGLSEPAIAELSDGSLLMICRGSNYTISRVPSYKWRSISKDGGYTWSNPEPWRYDTGENFFSPAAGSRLIRSSRNGKLYWIGNIIPQSSKDGARPRYPLNIAEVDEVSGLLRKNTVAVIDDRQENDSEWVQLSNFRVYEDRETGEFVVTLARCQEKCEKDLSSPAYQYKVIIR